MLLKISDPVKEGVYQGSKWLKIQALIDADEMQQMFASLGDFWIFSLNGIFNGDPISREDFLQNYTKIINTLKEGNLPSKELLKNNFACVIAENLQSLWLQKVGEQKFILKMSEPCVILQSHYFTYSNEDKTVRPMSMGENSIFWGFQILFPQIYQDPKSGDFVDIGPSLFFKTMQRFLRNASKPVVFKIGGQKINTSMRLGCNCYSWIGNHPQLKQQNIQIFSSIDSFN